MTRVSVFFASAITVTVLCALGLSSAQFALAYALGIGGGLLAHWVGQ